MSEFVSDLSRPGVRVVLAGTGTHDGSAMPEIPAVKDNLHDLAQTLIENCGVPEPNIRPLLHPADPQEMRLALTQAAKEAEDALLFYFVGHGLIDSDNRLHLATKATYDWSEGLLTTALPYSFIRDTVKAARPRISAIVLDCCFSGTAQGVLGALTYDTFELTDMDGSFLLMSAGRDEMALAPRGKRHTAFTGELIRALREGNPTYPAQLTLNDIYDLLRRRLSNQGLPEPRSQSSGRAGYLVLARNPAAREPVTLGEPAEPPRRSVCPYRGLESFRLEDTRYFYGREALTQELMGRLATRLTDGGLLPVLGPSGSGKSSLLQAGLVPAVKNGNLKVTGSRTWPCHVLTPGEHPLTTLARRFGDKSAPRDIANQLLGDPALFVTLVRDWLASTSAGPGDPGRRLILIVDQFEEVFTACRDHQERSEFVRCLVAVCTSREAPAAVVLGVRSDFYTDCLEHAALVPALRDNQLIVPQMDEQELRDVIEKPAAVVGLGIEDGLVDNLLKDLSAGSRAAQESGGVLPLLSYALMATWQHSGGGSLTLKGYQGSGGIWQAVAREAERVYESFTSSQRATARRVLVRMVRVGDGVDDTRRRVELEELGRQRSTGEVQVVCDALAAARLVTLDRDHAEITHEALLRAWPRLRDWIDADRAGNLIRQDLEKASGEWDRDHRDSGGLYRGTRLEAARTWFTEHPDEASRRAAEFLQASIRQERRSTRLRRAAVALPSILALLASMLTYVAFTQRSIAQEERDNAVFNQITAQANRFRGTDVSLAAQLDLIAYRMRPTDQTLYTNLLATENAALATTLAQLTGTIWAAAFSPDGHTVAVAVSDDSGDGEVRLWNVADRAHPVPLEQPIPGNNRTIVSLAFSPDGRTLAVAANDGKVQLWNVADPRHPVPFGKPITNQAEIVSDNAVVFSPDGRTLATAARSTDIRGGSSLRLWNVTDPRHPTPLGQPLFELTTNSLDGPNTVTFSPDGRLIAAALGSGTVRLWNVVDAASPVPQGQDTSSVGNIDTIAFSRDGRTLAGGGYDGTVQLWDVTDPDHPTRVGDLPTGHDGPIYSIAFSPDGQFLATSGNDSTIRLWSTADPAHPTPLGQPLTGDADAVTHIAFGPDSHTLVATSGDGNVRLWDIPDTILVTDNSGVDDVVFSHDNQLLSAGAVTLYLWNVADFQKPRTAGNPPSGSRCCISAHTLHPSGEVVAAADDSIRLWNITDTEHTAETGQPIDLQGESVTTMTFSPSGHLLAGGTAEGTVSLWRFAKPNYLTPLKQLPTVPNYFVHSLAFSPDGGTLASASENGGVQLWDVTEPILQIFAPAGQIDTSEVYALTFSPDGQILATAGTDQKIRLWDISDRAYPIAIGQPIDSSTRAVYSLAFSPDGRILASGGYDHVVRLWNIDDPTHPTAIGQPIDSHADSINSLTFSLDGRLLATGSADHTVRIWTLNVDQAIARICATTGNTLTPDTWRRYVSEQLPFNPPCR